MGTSLPRLKSHADDEILETLKVGMLSILGRKANFSIYGVRVQNLRQAASVPKIAAAAVELWAAINSSFS